MEVPQVWNRELCVMEVALSLAKGFTTVPMCCRIPNIVEYMRDPLQAGLVDRSAYVRKTAVVGVVKLFYITPEVVTGECVGG